MLLNTYKDSFNTYFDQPEVGNSIEELVQLFHQKPRIFFIGNGGSNSICSHMYEDFGKMARLHTFAFSDPALITCYANDYGYENTLSEWLKLYFQKGDMLIAISSSGNSPNIVNAVDTALGMGGIVVTLSGFNPDNKIRHKGRVNFHIPYHSYGIVESYHQVILHVALDQFLSEMK